MNTYAVTYGASFYEIAFTPAAWANIEELGIPELPEEDFLALLEGQQTPAELLEECLDGADADREQGWRDYVAALERAVSS